MEGKEGVRVHVRACALQAELRRHSLVALRHAGSRLGGELGTKFVATHCNF